MALDFLDPALLEPAFADTAEVSLRHNLSLHVRMPDGGWLTLPAHAGATAAEALADFGVPVRKRASDCLHTPSARLASAWRRDVDDDGTRSLSDLVLTPDLDGLALELPWDALEPQTNWVAG